MSQGRDTFRRFVCDSLAKNPDWLGCAIEAISEGMERAIADLRAQRGACDLAMRSALILAAPGRISQETKSILNGAIICALGSEGLSKIERETSERLTNGSD